MSIALALPLQHDRPAPAVVAAHLATIDRAVGVVARRRRLSPDEAQELRSDVYLKLLQDDAAALRSFRGDSRLLTFLVIVVERVLLDARIARDGKWRASATARRLGAVAVALERLIFHEGLRLQEAAGILRTTPGVVHTDDELHFLLSLLPVRLRRRMVGERELDAHAVLETPAEAALAREALHLRDTAVRQALAALTPDERRMITLRFEAGLPLSQIARQCGIDERVIYRRFHRVLCGLRAALRPPPATSRRSSPAPRPAPAHPSARRP
jgi:RNA polymerase sigma factor (sigma-70 family)